MKLEQNKQFVPSEKKVEAILANYSVVPRNIQAADSGIENLTLYIESSQGSYVLRIYRRGRKSAKRIQQELDFIDFLAHHGVKVATPLPNLKGLNLTRFVEDSHIWYAILMQRVPGGHAQTYTPSLLANMAHVQAKMHILAPQFINRFPAGKRLSVLREGVYLKLIDDTHVLSEDVRGLLTRAKNYEATLSPELPAGFCHLDYDKDNLLSDEGGNVTAVLDFDDLAVAPYIVCLGYCLWDIAMEAGEPAVADYLRAYESVRTLLPIERSYLKPVMLFRHYVIASADVALGVMDPALLARFLLLEKQLRNQTSFVFLQ